MSTTVKGFFSGVEFIHKRKVIHADIAPKNILMDENNNLILADFESANIERFYGSCRYMAPELSPPKSGKPNKQSDVFTLGFVILQMLEEEKNIFKAWDFKNSCQTYVLGIITDLIGIDASKLQKVCDKELTFQPDSQELLSKESCDIQKANKKKVLNDIGFKMMKMSPEGRISVQTALLALDEFIDKMSRNENL